MFFSPKKFCLVVLHDQYVCRLTWVFVDYIRCKIFCFSDIMIKRVSPRKGVLGICDQLSFTPLLINSADDKLVIFILFFQKTECDISCILSPTLFSGKHKKKNISICRLLKSLPGVLSVKMQSTKSRSLITDFASLQYLIILKEESEYPGQTDMLVLVFHDLKYRDGTFYHSAAAE